MILEELFLSADLLFQEFLDCRSGSDSKSFVDAMLPTFYSDQLCIWNNLTRFDCILVGHDCIISAVDNEGRSRDFGLLCLDVNVLGID